MSRFSEKIKSILAISPDAHEDGILDIGRAIERLLRESNFIASCIHCGNGRYETFSKQEHLVKAYPEFAAAISYHSDLGQRWDSVGSRLCSYCESKGDR